MLIAQKAFTLSPLQQRKWQCASRADAPCRAQCAFEICGRVDPGCLRRALEQVQKRHETLQVRVHASTGSEAIACVPGEAETWLDFVHSRTPKLPGKEELPELFAQLLLSQTPTAALRAHLMSESETHHYLLLSVPETGCDAISLRLLVKEMRAFYEGDHRSLETPIQYAEAVEWQRGLALCEEAKPGIEFWTTLGWEASRSVKLPDAMVSGTAFSPRHAGVWLENELSVRLRELAVETGVELPTLLLAAWVGFLRRLIDDDRFTIGYGIDGRSCHELSGAFGPYSRYLPLVAECGEPQSVPGLAAAFHRQIERMLRWQDVFAWPEANGGRDQFISLCYEFHDWPEFSLAASRCLPAHAESYMEQFEVALQCHQAGRELMLQIAYDQSIYSPAAISNVLHRFLRMLATVAASPDSSIGAIDIRTEADIALSRVLAPDFDIDCRQSAGALLESAALANAESIALVCGEQTMTFAELSRRTNQLANYLRAAGVGLETRVALALPRSLEMVLAVLAVIKAGGIYVPIDPEYPAERVHFILEDSSASYLVISGAQASTLARGTANVIDLQARSKEVESFSADPVPDRIERENLVYIIYTSGSTGRPKGVMVTHGGLVNYLAWSARTYEIDKGAGSIVHSSLSFDLTVTALLTPLAAGRKVEIIQGEEVVESLAAQLQRIGNLSVLKITPAHLDSLASSLSDQPAPGHIGSLVVGGEALRGSTVAFWNRAKASRIVNEYGPTETVVGCCVYQVEEGDEHLSNIPIGRPIANTKLHVLNSMLHPVPPGVTGELYICGEGVARGYWRRPELTAERFLPDPFSRIPGARMYKSGDRVRLSSSGQLEYLGRNDDQVKVRGFRIELGEIEAVICQHPDVVQASVIVHSGPRGKSLAAYMVPAKNRRIDIQPLQAWISGRLPHYMVPGIFVPVRSLPLTNNGKVDRARLPDPEQIRQRGL